MLGTHRQKRILERLAAIGALEVAELAVEFQCSEKTIRRDLELLEGEGLLRRVHGGALPVVATSSDDWATVPVSERLGTEAEAKRKIAASMARRISGGMTVFLDGGSTALALATQLVSAPSLTVVTTMLDIAKIVDRSRRHRVFQAGGEMISATGTVRGPETLQFVGARRYDLTVLGATAINAKDGVMAPTEWHGVFADLLRQSSDQLAVIADATKFGLKDRFRACSFAHIDILVSNAIPPNDIIEQCRMREIRLIVD